MNRYTDILHKTNTVCITFEMQQWNIYFIYVRYLAALSCLRLCHLSIQIIVSISFAYALMKGIPVNKFHMDLYL